MIPKTLHFIWIGDETRCPANCIDTWRAHHPDWKIVVWGNRALAEGNWTNRRHMKDMYNQELCGVADLMRWEILYKYGGIAIDADSYALRPLDDHLLDCEAFACWENEVARPGLISNAHFGCETGNAFVRQIIMDITAEATVTNAMAWTTTGPLRLTHSYRKYRYAKLRIYPSHFFMPQHFSGQQYQGDDIAYANHLWGSTRNAYDQIHKLDLSAFRSSSIVRAHLKSASELPFAPLID